MADRNLAADLAAVIPHRHLLVRLFGPRITRRRRAWECIYVLREEFPDRLTQTDRLAVEVLFHAGFDAFGWRLCRRAFRLYAATVADRT